MNLSSGKTATEEREVKIRWQNTQKSFTGEILKSLILFPKLDMKMHLITSIEVERKFLSSSVYTRDRGKGRYQAYIKSEIIWM